MILSPIRPCSWWVISSCNSKSNDCQIDHSSWFLMNLSSHLFHWRFCHYINIKLYHTVINNPVLGAVRDFKPIRQSFSTPSWQRQTRCDPPYDVSTTCWAVVPTGPWAMNVAWWNMFLGYFSCFRDFSLPWSIQMIAGSNPMFVAVPISSCIYTYMARWRDRLPFYHVFVFSSGHSHKLVSENGVPATVRFSTSIRLVILVMKNLIRHQAGLKLIARLPGSNACETTAVSIQSHLPYPVEHVFFMENSEFPGYICRPMCVCVCGNFLNMGNQSTLHQHGFQQ